MDRNFIVAVVGPTASGKTGLGIELAEHFNGEVVACDSRTVYRYMDIGTAKPMPSERKGIAHHMIDLIDPDQEFSAAQYAQAANESISGILSRQRLPIICGGTGFYLRATVEGLKIPAVPPETGLRHRLNQAAERFGNTALKAELVRLDPDAAARIHVNDRFRLIRALEVSMTTGKPFSKLATLEPSAYRIAWIGLSSHDRSFLYTRIASRLKQQLDFGLLEEVASLYERFGDCRTLLSTISYSEFIAHLRGELSFEQAHQSALQHACNLASRQAMWFRPNKQIQWLPIDQIDRQAALKSAIEFIDPQLG